MKTFALAAVSALGLTTGTLCAGSLDMTAQNSSGVVNGALFQAVSPQPTGTGVIQSFLRLQAKGNATVESAYNTDGRDGSFNDFDAKSDPNFTRSLLLSDLAVTQINGVNYHQFLLDINEPGGSKASLSMSALKFYLGTAGNLTPADPDSLGTLVYDLDAGEDNTVEMKDQNAGSGQGDYLVSIPESLFQSTYTNGHDYVYLFTSFGTPNSADGGFEEWAAVTGERPTAIPLPAAAWSGISMLGVMGIGAARRRMKRQNRA